MSDLRRREFITLLGGADRAALDWRLNAVHLPRLAAGTRPGRLISDGSHAP